MSVPAESLPAAVGPGARPVAESHGASRASSRSPLPRRRLLAAGLAAALPWPAALRAEDRWPSRAVTVVSPYAPGGTNDVVARLAAERLQRALGQAFVVDNRPGSAGVVGVQSVIRARPDGYTLLAGNNGSVVIQSAARATPPYDPARQLSAIGRIANAAQFLAVSGDLPVRNVADFVAYARQRPGQLNYASAGVGSFGQFLVEHLKLQAGIDMVHVPCRGSAAALTELLAHRVQLMIDPLVLGHAGDDRLRVLATLGEERFAAQPQIPTIREAGGPAVELTGWFGLFGPAGLSAEIVDRLAVEGSRLAAAPEVRSVLVPAGLTPAWLAGEPFDALLRADMKRVAAIRTRANIVLE